MLEKVLGPSPWPTLFGYIAGVLLDARVLIETKGQPSTVGDWFTLGIGVALMAMGRVSKAAFIASSTR